MQPLINAAFFITSLAIATYSFGQKQENDSTAIIDREMDSTNVYEMSYTIGYAGNISKQYLHFEKLLKLASSKELSELTVNRKKHFEKK